MEDYVKIKDELEDRLSAQQQSIQVMLQNQDKMYTNVSQLLIEIEKFKGLLEEMLNNKSMQNSMILQKNTNVVKASEVVSMQLQQIMANKSVLMRNKNFRATLNSESININPKKEPEKPLIKLNTINDEDKTDREKVNPYYTQIDKIEVLLIEQRLKEAVEEYNALKRGSRQNLDLSVFIRLKKVENIIVEELIGSASLISPGDRFDLNKLIFHIDILNDFGRYEEAIQVAMNYAATFVKTSKKSIRDGDRISEFLRTAEELLVFLSDKFTAIFAKGEYKVYFSSWFLKNLQQSIDEFIASNSENKNMADLLERLKMEVSDFGAKGFSCDFMLEPIIYDLQAHNSI